MNDYQLARLRQDELIGDARRSRSATAPRWLRWAKRRLTAQRIPEWTHARSALRIVR
ncbi:MAG TPA: hypothetical protein VHV74_15890 [Pseudonocardiaceae bacterium]|jgi:hypothetical protein|nr:hypothetical protein [Pseudonocardiaceae bacterium]